MTENKKRRGAGKRGEPSLSRARVAQAAVALLDEQGVSGLTMRRLAKRLDSGVMSVYWHVDNKDEIFDLALDHVLDYQRPDVLDADWRAQVVHLLEDWRAIMLRHPWSAMLLPQRALGENILKRLDLLGELLSEAGVADEDLNAAIWTIWNFVMGATVTLASFISGAEQRDTQPPIQGHHPTIERTGLLHDGDWDGVFRRGVNFMLDGFV